MQGGMQNGMARLTAARRLRKEMGANPGGEELEEEPTEEGEELEEEVGEDATYEDDPVLALGHAPAAIIMEYGEEIDAELDGSDLKGLKVDDEPTDKLLDAAEECIGNLPGIVQSAVGDLEEVPMPAMVAAGARLEEKGMTKNGGRLSAFLFLASRLGTLGGGEEEEEMGEEEEEPMDEMGEGEMAEEVM